MALTIVVLCVAIALQLSLHEKFGWKFHWPIALVIGACVGFVGGHIILMEPGGFASVIFVFISYRAFNLFRTVEARMPIAHLRRVTYHTGAWLAVAELCTLIVWGLDTLFRVPEITWVEGIVAAQFFVAAVFLLSSLRRLQKTRPLKIDNDPAQLPSLTVAIPARNEGDMLEGCLRSVLASDYPKLEVLVLDDCSRDKTPEIIRNLAHDGVRFVPGEEPSASWLAKNQAYYRLSEQASGEIILFCGVDVRFKPSSIRQLVATMQHKKKSMLSVLPLNRQQHPLPLAQSLRYYWLLAPPRRLFRWPPVLSTCWMVRRDMLQKAGGFKAVSRLITPEEYFALRAAKWHDGYSFRRSNSRLGITSIKRIAEQRATAIRRRYPQAHHRPELVCAMMFFDGIFLLGPIFLAVSMPFFDVPWLLELLAIIAAVLHFVTFGVLLHPIFPRSGWRRWVAFPAAIFLDMWTVNVSMYKYEFSEVIWKGRNVCLPVMHVVPRLPNLK
jgi:hypothetical protein